MIGNWSATGLQLVGDRLSIKNLVGNWLLMVVDGRRLSLSATGCRYSVTEALRDGHTIATTSRRPLTTTIFGWLPEVVGGRHMFVDDRWLVVRELHRQPLADLRQPPFFRVVFDGRQMVVDDRRAVLVGQRFSMQHQQPSTTKQGCHTKWIYIWSWKMQMMEK